MELTPQEEALLSLNRKRLKNIHLSLEALKPEWEALLSRKNALLEAQAHFHKQLLDLQTKQKLRKLHCSSPDCRLKKKLPSGEALLRELSTEQLEELLNRMMRNKKEGETK